MRIAFAAAILLAAASPAAIAQGQPVSISLPDSAPSGIFSKGRTREVLTAQILLDRSRHSPGVIDGYMGANTKRAIRAYQRANGFEVTGQITPKLLSHMLDKNSGSLVQSYEITKDDVDGPFVDVPSGFTEMAKLDHLGYETPLELVAAKFHMDQDFLKALNPTADFLKTGTKIVVIAPGGEKMDKKVARIEVDKSRGAVRAFAEDGTLVATYPATIGSQTFPSPDGAMEVRAIAPDPKYYFTPEGRDWGPDKNVVIAAGPNNPIGGTWIDLTKEGYGIHGSPDPHMVGKRTSHGCVRLTNWDAEELAGAVSQGTKVKFV